MGIGNYYPIEARDGMADFCYVEVEQSDNPEMSDEENAEIYSFNFSDFEETLVSMLPKSFWVPHNCWDERGRRIIGENGFMKVGLADNQSNIALVFLYRETDSGGADGRGRPIARRMVRQLMQHHYEIWGRDTAWTSFKVTDLRQVF